jgi:small conductance mechanosensitive channel
VKKLFFILYIVSALLISNNSKAETLKQTPHITVSVNASTPEQKEKLANFLKEYSNEESFSKKNTNRNNQSIISKENIKRIFESNLFKDFGKKLVKIILIITIISFIKKVIKATMRITITNIDKQKKITAKQKQKAHTILPLINNTLNIIFFILTLLIVLSELGIDIAPLLAGAGVIGLAIGFGAQTLVKDFITGFFILLENTISVGDIISIGGLSGKVESLSIKSVVLRDLHGTVHTIPFSEVTTISNKTKDFSFAVFEIGVAYRESIDQVLKEINKIAKQMFKDIEISKNLLGKEVEIFGVESLADSSVIIKGRFKTKAGRQWDVNREFNRRVKSKFDELGIEIPFPHTTIYFGEDKEDSSPALNVKVNK